jgi:predicted nucleic acid-binding protein
MIFVDSNVLIDLSDRIGVWSSWSRTTLRGYREPLVTNAVVFAEISARFSDLDLVDIFLGSLGVALLPLDSRAAFRAGEAHAAYRRAGGARQAILADFLIAGHASVLGAMLATRDRQRFASYFPELRLLSPEDDG